MRSHHQNESEEQVRRERLAKAERPAADAMRSHPFYGGKVQIAPKVPVRDVSDFSIWYTPGVAAPCRDIAAHPERVWDHTNKGNTVAVVSDGTRVLGLGDIGPEAGLPVMEGKALIFKYLGGVDAVPICLDTRDPDLFIQTVKLLQPSFGGINLEDIAKPKCFRILDTLRSEMDIPVWHDDQQGTAAVTLAGLINALKVVGKRLDNVNITMIGAGAANVAILRLALAAGADPGRALMVDTRSILGRERAEFPPDDPRAGFCQITNAENRRGGVPEALSGADVAIALSGVAQDDETGRHPLCLCQPHPRDLALGGQGSRGAHRRHRAQRFPQPGQQLAGLSRHLSRRARRESADDQRRDGHRRGLRDRSLCGGKGTARRIHRAHDGRVGRLPSRGRGHGDESPGTGPGSRAEIARDAVQRGQGHHTECARHDGDDDGQRTDRPDARMITSTSAPTLWSTIGPFMRTGPGP